MSPLYTVQKLNFPETITEMDVFFRNTALVLCVCLVLKILFSRKPDHFRSLCGKHVLITGASSGVGFALAKRCLSEGAFVTLVARNEANLMNAAEKLIKSVGCHSDRILSKAVNVGDASAVSLAIKESFHWRPIDVLICNAAQTSSGVFDSVDVKDIDTVTRTNILGSVYPIHAALPLMKSRSLENPSSIVIMSSLSGLLFVPVTSMYTPTKYALKGLAELLRIELIPHNIRVNLVCPGFTRSSMLDTTHSDDIDPLFSDLPRKLLFFNKGDTESPDEIARKTVAGLKRGDFLITTSVSGFLVGALTRGFIPAESASMALMEMIFILPMRILSFLWLGYTRNILQKQLEKNLEKVRHPEEKPYVHSIDDAAADDDRNLDLWTH